MVTAPSQDKSTPGPVVVEHFRTLAPGKMGVDQENMHGDRRGRSQVSTRIRPRKKVFTPIGQVTILV